MLCYMKEYARDVVRLYIETGKCKISLQKAIVRKAYFWVIAFLKESGDSDTDEDKAG